MITCKSIEQKSQVLAFTLGIEYGMKISKIDQEIINKSPVSQQSFYLAVSHFQKYNWAITLPVTLVTLIAGVSFSLYVARVRFMFTSNTTLFKHIKAKIQEDKPGNCGFGTIFAAGFSNKECNMGKKKKKINFAIIL